MCRNPRSKTCRRACVVAAFLGLSGCGDLAVRRSIDGERARAALLGEWHGAWQSDTSPDVGVMTIRVQEFDGLPVVAVVIDNPCFPTGNCELDVRSDVVVLRRQGEAVMFAQFAAAAQLVGTYGCGGDAGRWQAVRVGALPAPLDLGGGWHGWLGSSGMPAQPMWLQLAQHVVAGALVLDGLLVLPDTLPAPIALPGFVHFRAQDFEFVLHSAPGGPGSGIELVLSGLGAFEPLRVDQGWLQVLHGPSLPVSQAAFQLEHVPQ